MACVCNSAILLKIFFLSFSGEKLTDDEVDSLLQGIEDGQGQVNYEGELLNSIHLFILI